MHIRTSFIGGTTDAYFAILSADGTTFDYSTYFGGSTVGMRDAATDIAIDSLGRAVIVGYTESSDLPTAGSAYQLVNDGGRDAFVAVINPAGTGASDLVYSSYLGGAQNEIAYGVALDSGDRIHLVGDTASNCGF